MQVDDKGRSPEPKRPGFDRPLAFETVYRAYFRQVVGWMRAMNVPPADMEDAAQEVFLVVRRKLPRFHDENLAGWLYRIADLTARNYRRLAWFKHLFARDPMDETMDPWPMTSSPAISLEQKEDHRTLFRMMASMSAKRRETLILFEIEGYSGQEIAALQGVPIKTVWTRLHHARRDLMEMVATLRRRHDREVGKP